MGQTRYEFSDADPRLIAALAGGIAVFLILTPLVLTVVYPAAARSQGGSSIFRCPGTTGCKPARLKTWQNCGPKKCGS